MFINGLTGANVLTMVPFTRSEAAHAMRETFAVCRKRPA